VEYSAEWDACTECAALIDRNDWEGLYQRTSVARGTLPGWKFLPDEAKLVAVQATRELHAEFRRRRLRNN
jgi:hypothetical protein